MKRLLALAVLWPALVLAGGLGPIWAAGPAGMQVMSMAGRVLDQAGRELPEYSLLDPGRKYQLLPGASLELVSQDGSRSYLARGPGILLLAGDGRVLFNGKPLAANARSAARVAANAGGGRSGELGAAHMRSRDGVGVVVRTRSGRGRLIKLYTGYHALVIGVGEYRAGWPMLARPVEDARQVAGLLRSMGWEVDLILNPDSAALRDSLFSLVTGQGRQKEKGILIWYSGHGHTLDEADGAKLGYLVPVDAPDPDRDEMGFMQKALSMRQVETVALRIKAKHVLMLFDSCFSGAIFAGTRAKPSPFIEEKVSRPVRQFITAGTELEKVPDRSVFKTVFLQALKEGDADRNHDGYVTGQELGAYLQEQVVNYSNRAQHPQFGKLNNPLLDKGDFVFTLARPQAPPVRAAQAPPAPAPPKMVVASLPKPAGPARDGLTRMLQSWQEAWNRFDQRALLGFYAEDASVETQTGRDGVVIVDKERLERILANKLPFLKDNSYTRRMVFAPKVRVRSGKATATVVSRIDVPGQNNSVEVVESLELARRGGRWLITSYRFQPRGVARKGGPAD